MSACGDPAAIAEWWSGLAGALFFGGAGVAVGVGVIVVAVSWARGWRP